MAKTKIITIYNNKGGSGKTLIAVNLAACLAMLGYRVLIIDSDDQCNASAYMDSEELTPTLAGIYDRTEHEIPVHPTKYHENLFICPSSEGLELMGYQMFAKGELEYFVLRDALKPIKDKFDFILIDTPPARYSVLTWNAMIASDIVVTPMDVDGLGGFFGIKRVNEFISEIRHSYNSRLDWLGMVLNKVKDDWTSDQVITQAKGYLKSESLEKTVFKTQIKYLDRYGSSSVNRKPIVFIENNGLGRKNFMDLAKEFLKRINNN